MNVKLSDSYQGKEHKQNRRPKVKKQPVKAVKTVVVTVFPIFDFKFVRVSSLVGRYFYNIYNVKKNEIV